MSNIDDIINEVIVAQATASVCLRGDLLAQCDELTDQLERLVDWTPGDGDGLAPVDPRTALITRLRALREEMEASTQKFTFHAISPKVASDLLADHPPKKDENGETEYLWNLQTYPPAFTAACSLDPKMTEEQARRLFDKLNQAQRNEVFGAAVRANQRQVDIPFFAAVSEKAASTE